MYDADEPERLYDPEGLEQPLDLQFWELVLHDGDLKVRRQRPLPPVPPHTIEIEIENGTWPDGWSLTNCNSSVDVTLADGTRWWAMFYTYDNIRSLAAKTNAPGKTWAADIFLCTMQYWWMK